MNIETVVKLAGREEVDYQFLLSLLSDYAYPRDKITGWLKTGDLIRVKKGLYVFGKRVSQSPYSLEVLANLIYGPSAISLNYALSYYGFIPERTTTITSITSKRNKHFATPVGEFTYAYLSPIKYATGMELSDINIKKHFFIASPEKALCDYIYLIDKKMDLENIDAVHAYLLQDLRIDETALRTFRIDNLMRICEIYNDKRLFQLINFIKKWNPS